MDRLEDSVKRRTWAAKRLRTTRIACAARASAVEESVLIVTALRDGRVSVEEASARPELADLGTEAIESAAIEIRYEGYIARQKREVERARRGEHLALPDRVFDEPLNELSREGREKLRRVRPSTLAQASRIPGMSPADVSVLLIYAERERRRAGVGPS
jgi:tRNA uridine 5-carboxymethylaminomethyl modification enzyme